jgi:pilus assembly protein CpaC
MSCRLIMTALAFVLAIPATVGLCQQKQVDFRVEEGTNRLEMVVNSSRILAMDTDIPRVLVNNRAVLRVVPLSPNQVQISALKPGVTQVNLWDKEGGVRSIDVIVYPDARRLEMIIRSEFPNAAIRVRPLDNSVILAGYVDRPEVIGQVVAIAEDFYPKVINNIAVGGIQQVSLHVKVMEVSRTKFRALGIDWAITDDDGFLISTAAGLISATGGGIVGTGADTVRFGVVNGNTSFDAFIEALRRNDLVKILAEPTLVTVSGRPASFQEGGEFPIIVAQGIGANSIEFKQFGTRVDFVPIVLGNGNIRLEVRPQVSEIDASRGIDVGGAIVPGLRTRWVDTAAEMRSGQTLALAGLIQTRTEATTRGLPWLADLPFTGAIFRRNAEEVNEIELLVTVRPELVAALDPHQVPPTGPGEHTISPNDKDFYGRGYLEVPRCCPDVRCTTPGGLPLNGGVGIPLSANPNNGPERFAASPYPNGPGTTQPIAGAGMANPRGVNITPAQTTRMPVRTIHPIVPRGSANNFEASRPMGQPTTSPNPRPQMFGPTGYDPLSFN